MNPHQVVQAALVGVREAIGELYKVVRTQPINLAAPLDRPTKTTTVSEQGKMGAFETEPHLNLTINRTCHPANGGVCTTGLVSQSSLRLLHIEYKCRFSERVRLGKDGTMTELPNRKVRAGICILTALTA